uniref:Delta-1-pyrroline-5-carboxylate dehydrogenase n=1 Tax=Stygiella incarcerata TaxID=1712417 RepID=A0A192ZIT0_9EUKA|nr:delta-1-pyrroline-5-carboxylate dehydrogenase [Stygiella incarcerata]
MSALDFATFDPETVSGSNVHTMKCFLDGKWIDSAKYTDIVDPMNGEVFIKMPNVGGEELKPFIEAIDRVPKSGLHNPLKDPERYRLYGSITHQLAVELDKEEVAHFFTRCIQRVCPKSYGQAPGEGNIVKTFLQNFCGDQVRFLARGFHVPGDHTGQQSNGYRWPFGGVAIVAPFNFPLEIPVLQMMGALYMGNHVTLKCASTTAMVMEQWIRLMIKCGMPPMDANLIHCGGRNMGELIEKADVRVLQFTGSSEVAEALATVLRGKIRVEDAGFDWKILGPDVKYEDYIAWQCDQDAYAATGQKCSAESILFMHENWAKTDLLKKMEAIASERSIEDLTVGPVLSHTTEEMLGHKDKILKIPGAKVLFGGVELKGHTIPKCYGAIAPTAVFVPLKEMMKPENFGLCTTEIFGPFQVVTEYKDDELDLVLEACERMHQHLTAAVVSNDPEFLTKCLKMTVNGTTYCGLRARTTGAPQNHWFGPAGDPRGAGIGSIEAIRLVWSCHREIIEDFGPTPEGWTRPKPT